MERVIDVGEAERRWLPAAALSSAEATLLHSRFADQIDLRPQIGAAGGWWLAGRGWVGTLRCGDVRIILHPKTTLANLAHLLALGYDLPPAVGDDLRACASVAELADRLAGWLADGVLRRVRRGIYRAYQPHDDRLPYLRGRLRVTALTPTDTRLPVTYKQLTADLLPNRVLAHTLHALRHSAVLTPTTAERVRRAARALAADVALDALPVDWWGRLRYDRLNDDYRPLHVLCRLLLDGLGPATAAGDGPGLPFLLDMAQLFERAVAAWLRRHLPPAYALRAQEHSTLVDGRVQIIADLVLIERAGGRVHSVLDTKYKRVGRPANEDIYQVVFYANARRSPRAVLVYPAPPAEPLDGQIDAVRLRTLTFDLARDVDAAGHALLAQLLHETTHLDRSMP